MVLAGGMAALLGGGTRFAAADIIGYRATKDLRAEGKSVLAEHHHRGSGGLAPSWLRVVDAASGAERWKRRSPPLHVLWLSPDEKHVVGLSPVKLFNRAQLFVAATDGAFEHRQRVDCATLAALDIACGESVTNYVYWYDGDDPGVELVLEDGKPAAVSFNRLPLPSCAQPETPDEEERCRKTPRRATLRLAPASP
jgi:hypothetical protein